MSAISLRLPNSIHNKVREVAQQEGISINSFIATALAEKLSALLASGVQPYEIGMVTFTKTAAGVFKERILKSNPEYTKNDFRFFGTMHSTGTKLIGGWKDEYAYNSKQRRNFVKLYYPDIEQPIEEYPEDDKVINFLFIGRIMKAKGIDENLEYLFNKKLGSIKNKSVKIATQNIKQFLVTKGYSYEVVGTYVDGSIEFIKDIISEDDILVKDFKVAVKKYKSSPNRKKNLIAYLLRKGYDYSKIKVVMGEEKYE